MPTTIWEPLTDEHVSQVSFRSSCVSGVLQIPAFILSVSGPSACPAVQCTSVLSQAHWLSLKTPNLRDPARCGPMLILWGRVSPHRGWCQFVPEGQLHQCAEAWSLKCNKNLASRLAGLSRCLHPYAKE